MNTTIVVHNRDHDLFMLLFIFDQPTAKLAKIIMLNSIDACGKYCYPGRRINFC